MTHQDKKLLQSYLNVTQPFAFLDSQRHSSLIAGLKDARLNTKRDIQTGIYNPTATFGYEGNWLGCIGYFTILDQIGSCFKLKGKSGLKENENSIEYSIKHFAYNLINNDKKQLFALKALRNAFTHDFNLLNTPNSKSEERIRLERHKFKVKADISNPLWIVNLPLELWDGNIEYKNFSSTNDVTTINLFGIAELTEYIYKRIFDLLESDEIEINLSINSFINKYTFILYSDPI